VGVKVPDIGVFRASEGEEYTYRVTRTEGRRHQIEKPAHTLPSPGRLATRNEVRSVQLFASGKLIDRGLAEITIFNDKSWEAGIRLEGERTILDSGDRFNLRADGSEEVTIGRVNGIYYSGDSEGVSISLDVVSWQDSLPPI
jgi:hypothetical protein